MDTAYHEAIVRSQFDRLIERLAHEARPIEVERSGSVIFAGFQGQSVTEHYRARIDMSRYPVDPYWVGFINPDLPRDEWQRVSDTDPRYWPWSPMPALHGHFNITFRGAYRIFWCWRCTVPYFHYHGHEESWQPAHWPLDRVVVYLWDHTRRAEHPSRWRPQQRPIIVGFAERRGVTLPDGAGLGDL